MEDAMIQRSHHKQHKKKVLQREKGDLKSSRKVRRVNDEVADMNIKYVEQKVGKIKADNPQFSASHLDATGVIEQIKQDWYKGSESSLYNIKSSSRKLGQLRVLVLGENENSVAKLKQQLQGAPYSIPIAQNNNQATHVFLMINTGKKISNDARITETIEGLKSRSKSLIVFFEVSESQTKKQLAAKVLESFPVLQDAPWIPFFESRHDDFYRTVGVSTFLFSQKMIVDVPHICDFDFYLSCQTQIPEVKFSNLYDHLTRRLAFMVWWNSKAKDMPNAAKRLALKKCPTYVLVLSKKTIVAADVEYELGVVARHTKQIIILANEVDLKRGLTRKALVRQVFGSKFKFEKLLDEAHWVATDFQQESAASLIGPILKLSSKTMPNASLMKEFAGLEDSLGNASDDSHWSESERAVQESSSLWFPGTREWLFAEVRGWANDMSTHNIFGLVGADGAGKSVFAAQLINRGNYLGKSKSLSGPCKVVGYHMFQRNDPRFASSRNCILSLCKQFGRQFSGFREALMGGIENRDTLSMDMKQLFDLLLVAPMDKLKKKKSTRMIVVIDGLDECDQGNSFRKLILSRWNKTMPQWLGLFVTCQNDLVGFPPSKKSADRANMKLVKLTGSKQKADLMKFTSALLESQFEDKELKVAVETVMKKTASSFLYLTFVHHMVRSNAAEYRQLTVQDIKQLPESTSKYIETILDSLYRHAGEVTYRKMIGCIVASRGPFPLELWMYAAGLGGDLDNSFRSDGQFKRYWNAKRICEDIMRFPETRHHGNFTGVKFIHSAVADVVLANGSHLAVAQPHSAALEQIRLIFRRASNEIPLNAKQYIAKHWLHHLRQANPVTTKRPGFHLESVLDWLSRMDALSSSSGLMARMASSAPPGERTQTVEVGSELLSGLAAFGSRSLDMNYRQNGALLGTNQAADLANLFGYLTVQDPGIGNMSKHKSERSLEEPATSPLVRSLFGTGNGGTPAGLLGFLEGHEGDVTAVAASRGRVVSASKDRSLRIWDAASGRSIGEPLQGHTRMVSAVTFNHNGSWVISGSKDKSVRIWDTERGTLVREPLGGHSDWVTSVACNHNSSRVVSGCEDGSIRIWNPKSGKQVGTTLKEHKAVVTSLAFNQKGSRFVSASRDKTIRIWSTKSGKCLKTLRENDWVNAVAFNKDGTCIAAGSWREIKMWNCETWKPSGSPLIGHDGMVSSLCFSDDGTRLVSSSDDETICIWDLKTRKAIGSPLSSRNHAITSVAFDSKLSRVFAGSVDGCIQIWDVKKVEEMKRTKVAKARFAIHSILFNVGETRIVSSNDAYGVHLRDRVFLERTNSATMFDIESDLMDTAFSTSSSTPQGAAEESPTPFRVSSLSQLPYYAYIDKEEEVVRVFVKDNNRVHVLTAEILM